MRSAAADTAVAPVAVLALALVGALPGVIAIGVFGPGAVGLAAIPVTGCPAAAGSAAALLLDVGALAGLGRTALHGAAALYGGTALGGTAALYGAAALVVVAAVGAVGNIAAVGGSRLDAAGGFHDRRDCGAAVARVEDLGCIDAHGSNRCAVGGAVDNEQREARHVGEAHVVAVHVGDGADFVGPDNQLLLAVANEPGRAGNDDGCRVDLLDGERHEVDALQEGFAGGRDDGADKGRFGNEELAHDVGVAVGNDHVGINDEVHSARKVERTGEPCFGANLVRRAGSRIVFGCSRVGTIPRT